MGGPGASKTILRQARTRGHTILSGEGLYLGNKGPPQEPLRPRPAGWPPSCRRVTWAAVPATAPLSSRGTDRRLTPGVLLFLEGRRGQGREGGSHTSLTTSSLAKKPRTRGTGGTLPQQPEWQKTQVSDKSPFSANLAPGQPLEDH